MKKLAKEAKIASKKLMSLDHTTRKKILLDMAANLLKRKQDIVMPMSKILPLLKSQT